MASGCASRSCCLAIRRGCAPGRCRSAAPRSTCSIRNDPANPAGPAGHHQRALRRRPGAAPAPGDRARHRRLAPAAHPRAAARGLPAQRRARRLRRVGTGAQLHGGQRRAVRRRPRGHARRQPLHHPYARRSGFRSVSVGPHRTVAGAATPRMPWASVSRTCWRSAGHIRTTPTSRSTWPTSPCAAAAPINGVSRLHGQVSRYLFQPLFPRWPQGEVPVGHVTNGVHAQSWASEAAEQLWSEVCGRERLQGAMEQGTIDTVAAAHP